MLKAETSLRVALLAGNIKVLSDAEDPAVAFAAIGDVIGRTIATRPGGVTEQSLKDFMRILEQQIRLGIDHAKEMGEA